MIEKYLVEIPRSRVQKMSLEVEMIGIDFDKVTNPEEVMNHIGLQKIQLTGVADSVFIERLIEFVKGEVTPKQQSHEDAQ